MSGGSIWDGAFDYEQPGSTDGVAPYFERQCEEIERGSEGRVRARFARLQMAPRMSLPTLTDVVEKNALKQQDINDIYKPSTYAFDVYSDAYKFRVLTMELGAVYPVQVRLDKGIEDDLGELLGSYECIGGKPGGIWIEGDDDLASFMATVVSHSAKMRCILKRLSSGQ